MRRRKGFTLIEILIVIIIIGILATLGLTQYGKVMEKSRGAEAKAIIGTLRSEAAAFYLENDNSLAASATYPNGFDNTIAGIGSRTDQIPGPALANCAESHYFFYAVSVADPVLTTTATRCGAAGKGNLTPSAGKTLTLATTFPAGTDVWSGDGGY